MAYTPTGRPVGRPKTKEYQTISLKMPQALLARVQIYARLHRQSLSALIRDGVEWRITEGDPRGLGVSAPQHTPSDEGEYSGNTVIPGEVRGESEAAGMLQEIRTVLARQETQLQALAHAFEQRPVVSTPSAYYGNTTKAPLGQQSTPEPVREGHDGQAPQEGHVDKSNTVLHEETRSPQRVVPTQGKQRQPAIPPAPLVPPVQDAALEARRAKILAAIPTVQAIPTGISPTTVRQTTGYDKPAVANDLRTLLKRGDVRKVGDGSYVRVRAPGNAAQARKQRQATRQAQPT